MRRDAPAQPAASGPKSLRASIRRGLRDRQAAIAILLGLAAPALVMAVGMGIEFAHWVAVSDELQRTADVAALAGGTQYYLSLSASGAANAAADLAELNGAAGGSSRAWDTSSQTLSDNNITVQVGPSIRNANNTGLRVTVVQTVPLFLTRIMSSSTTMSLSATAYVQVAIEPCLLALSTTGSGISAQGSSSSTFTNCSVRSNTSISAGGSSAISAYANYAASTISGNVTGLQVPSAGTIADPYANNAPIQNAFAQLSAGSGSTFHDSPGAIDTLSPGTYSKWDIKGAVTLQPGIYYVNGDISLGDQASLSGTDVTIVSSGDFSMNGGATLSLSAATSSNATGGALPGVVIADNTPQSVTVGGNAAPTLTGLIYFPNASVSFAGTAGGGSSGCLQLVASTISLTGNSALAANCASYGTPLVSSDNLAAVALVQ